MPIKPYQTPDPNPHVLKRSELFKMSKPAPAKKRSARVWCYLRVSTGHQGLSGLGLQAQKDACTDYAKKLGVPLGDQWYGSAKSRIAAGNGFFIDAHASAYKRPLRKRPAGEALLSNLRPGDTLIVARMDRAFRSVGDFCRMSQEFEKNKIHLVVLSPRIDMKTANGRALAHMLATFAEWESARRSERIKAALHAKKYLSLNRKKERETNRAKRAEIQESEWRNIKAAITEEDDPAALGYRDDRRLKLQKENGRIHIYIRCSHRDSAESGNGMMAQILKANDYSKGLLKENNLLVMGELFSDPETSASQLPFLMRRAGDQLGKTLRKGDHVIIASLDRGFRSVRDMSTILPVWQEKGVEVHFVQEDIRTSDAAGKLMAHVMCLFAEYEAQIISERNREARAQAEAVGRYCGGGMPSCWKIMETENRRSNRKKKKLVVDRKRLVAVRTVKFLMNVVGMSRESACARLEDLMAKHEKRRPVPMCGVKPSQRANPPFHPNMPKDKRGNIWPYMTAKVYDKCRSQYDFAMESWRKVTAQKRRIRAEQEAKEAAGEKVEIVEPVENLMYLQEQGPLPRTPDGTRYLSREEREQLEQMELEEILARERELDLGEESE